MDKVATFFNSSWEEFTEHVTWPSFADLQSSTTLVLVGSLVFALIVGLMDFAFENLLKLFYQSF